MSTGAHVTAMKVLHNPTGSTIFLPFKWDNAL